MNAQTHLLIESLVLSVSYVLLYALCKWGNQFVTDQDTRHLVMMIDIVLK